MIFAHKNQDVHSSFNTTSFLSRINESSKSKQLLSIAEKFDYKSSRQSFVMVRSSSLPLPSSSSSSPSSYSIFFVNSSSSLPALCAILTYANRTKQNRHQWTTNRSTTTNWSISSEHWVVSQRGGSSKYILLPCQSSVGQLSLPWN